MRHRLAGAILLLYPRRVREGHGPEIMALIDDLIAYEGRSRTRLFTRLAVDGLIQRVASTATVWTVAAVLAATSMGGLAVSGFAAASAHQGGGPTMHTAAPASHTHQTHRHLRPQRPGGCQPPPPVQHHDVRRRRVIAPVSGTGCRMRRDT